MLSAAPNIHAQSATTQGKDFWVSFFYNYTDTTQIKLIVTGQRNCSGTVTNPQTNWSKSFTVRAHDVVEVLIPTAQGYSSFAGSSRNTGLHVVTTDTVSLYASSYEEAAFDVSNILPTNVLRDEYVVQTYKAATGGRSEFMVLATQDNTVVDITTSDNTIGNTQQNTRSYSITLNEGQTHLVVGVTPGDLSGSRVTSHDCKPIAVFAGNSAAVVPISTYNNKNCCGDFLFEQLMPMAYHGKKFVVTSSLHRSYDRVKITSDEAGCVVSIDGTTRATLSKNQSIEYELSSFSPAVYMECSKPVQVVLYFTGGQYGATDDNYVGDPSMVLIQPLEQQMKHVVFSTFKTKYTNNHYVNIVTSTATKSGMRLDGNSIAYAFSPVSGNTAYSYARIPVTYGSHTLENINGEFLAHVYGLGKFESYSYSVGSTAATVASKVYVDGTLSTPGMVHSICRGDALSFRAQCNYTIANTSWIFGDGGTSTQKTPTYTFNTDGTYQVKAVLQMAAERCMESLYDTTAVTIEVKAQKTGDIYHDICEGEYYTWHNVSYMATGNYSFQTTGSNGCDSTAVLHLNVGANSSSTVYAECIENELPYTYNGHTFSQADSQEVVIDNAIGCDSVIDFHLHVWNNVTAVADTTICENQLPFYWNAKRFSAAGIKQTTLTASHGQDSLLRMIVNVNNNTSYTYHQQTVENNLPVSFADLTFTTDQRDTTLLRTNAAGCDSVITYSLTVFRNQWACLDSTVCENYLPLTWNNKRFESAGQQQTTLSTTNGADSNITMTVTVNYNTTASYVDTLIEKELPHTFAGQTFTESDLTESGFSSSPYSYTNTTFTQTNSLGCDSLIYYYLHVWNDVSNVAETTICENQLPFYWNAKRFSAAGVKNATLIGCNGQDSVLTMIVNVNKNTSASFTDTKYENDLPYTFANIAFSTANLSNTDGRTTRLDTTIMRTNAAGCDSTIHYNLTVHWNTSVVESRTICENSLPITWNGHTFTGPEQVTTTLHRTTGADSVVGMALVVNRNSYATIRDTIVQNQLPHAFDSQLTLGKAQPDTTFIRTNAAGCDSVICYSLHVWNNVTAVRDSQVCENFFPFVWNDKRFSTDGIKKVTLTGCHGQDSTLTMYVTQLHNTTAYRSDTVVENSLPQVFDASLSFADTQADTTIVRQNADGCDSLIHYSLHVWHNKHVQLDSATCQNNLPLVWNGISFATDRQHTITLAASHGEDSVITMQFSVLHNTAYTQHDTIVQNQLPHGFDTLLFNNTLLNRPGNAYLRQTVGATTLDTSMIRQNAAGCDSLITYRLHVWHNTAAIDDSSLCENSLPLNWNGKRFITDGVKKATLTGRHGEDSVVTMFVTVRRNTSASFVDTIVENQLPFTFAGETFYSAQADTTLVRTNHDGCDSLINYNLFVHRNITTYHDSSLCENFVPLVWNGITFTSSSTRNVTLKACHGEDSTVVMRFHLLRNTLYSQHDTVVENALPFVFDTITYTSSRLSPHSTTITKLDTNFLRVNTAGCDSIINHSLVVWHNVQAMTDSMLCENFMPLSWNGVTFSLPFTNGGDNDTISTILTGCHGQDSLLYMCLHIKRNTYATFSDTIVENRLPHRFAGLTFTDNQADTTLLRQNHLGCDSIISYSLHVWYNTTEHLDSTVCENSLPLSWNGVTFADSPTLRISNTETKRTTLRTTNGADSTVVMTVGVLRNSYYSQHDTVVENNLPHLFDTIHFYRHTTSNNPSHTEGDTIFTRTNAAGCDSIISYSLHVWYNVHNNIDSQLCENYLPLVWNDITFTADSTLSATLTAAHGEDSLVSLSFHVLHNSSYSQHDTLVENLVPITFADLVFADSQSDTTIIRTNAAGCDSIINYSLHVWHNYSVVYDTDICEDYMPIVWHDSLFTQTSTKRHLFRSVNGADSLITLQLTVHNIYHTEFDAEICQNSSLAVGHKRLKFPGHYDVMLRSEFDCDSLVSVDLTVYEVYYQDTYDTICHGDSYIFEEHRFTKQGVYPLYYQSRTGCDSVLTLYLTVNPTYNPTDSLQLCYGHSITWKDGVTYSRSNTEALQHYYTVDRCDSVWHLYLIVDQPVHARMSYSPKLVTYENQQVRLSDITSNDATRQWLACSFGTTDTTVIGYSETEWMDYPMQLDSLLVILAVQSEMGCADTTSIVIHRDAIELWAPNAFTPELPSNNRFYFTARDVSDFEARIYNRQGLLVCVLHNIDEQWDGTHRGTPCPQGAYIYTAHYRSRYNPKSLETKTGSLLLIR